MFSNQKDPSSSSHIEQRWKSHTKGELRWPQTTLSYSSENGFTKNRQEICAFLAIWTFTVSKTPNQTFIYSPFTLPQESSFMRPLARRSSPHALWVCTRRQCWIFWTCASCTKRLMSAIVSLYAVASSRFSASLRLPSWADYRWFTASRTTSEVQWAPAVVFMRRWPSSSTTATRRSIRCIWSNLTRSWFYFDWIHHLSACIHHMLFQRGKVWIY